MTIMPINFKILAIILFGILVYECTKAQCPTYYSLVDDTTISVIAKVPEDYLLNDNIFEDPILGKIQIEVMPGILLYFSKSYFIFQYDLIFNVLINQQNTYHIFKPTRINIEFDDQSGFLLESKVSTFNFARDILKIDLISFYMNSKTYALIMNKNIYKISVIDDNHDKLINIYPNQQNIKTQARCISSTVPYETKVEYYNHVIDSLLNLKKYGKGF